MESAMYEMVRIDVVGMCSIDEPLHSIQDLWIYHFDNGSGDFLVIMKVRGYEWSKRVDCVFIGQA